MNVRFKCEIVMTISYASFRGLSRNRWEKSLGGSVGEKSFYNPVTASAVTGQLIQNSSFNANWI
jgi:hypothetical protein